LIVKNLDQLQIVFASEIDTTRIKEGVKFEPLLFTSKNSGETRGPRYDISYTKYMNKNLNSMLIDGSKVISGIYSGTFKSYFANNSSYSDAIKETSIGKILLVTDSDFIKEGAGAGSKQNLDFLLNAVDYMSSESGLIMIRSRETEYRPLKELSITGRKIVKWVNILLPAFILILIGILLYKKELNKRKVIGDLYE